MYTHLQYQTYSLLSTKNNGPFVFIFNIYYQDIIHFNKHKKAYVYEMGTIGNFE